MPARLPSRPSRPFISRLLAWHVAHEMPMAWPRPTCRSTCPDLRVTANGGAAIIAESVPPHFGIPSDRRSFPSSRGGLGGGRRCSPMVKSSSRNGPTCVGITPAGPRPARDGAEAKAIHGRRRRRLPQVTDQSARLRPTRPAGRVMFQPWDSFHLAFPLHRGPLHLWGEADRRWPADADDVPRLERYRQLVEAASNALRKRGRSPDGKTRPLFLFHPFLFPLPLRGALPTNALGGVGVRVSREPPAGSVDHAARLTSPHRCPLPGWKRVWRRSSGKRVH